MTYRNRIQIVGLGNRMKGTSKAGNPYDFQNISFLYPEKYTTGMAAGMSSLNGDQLDAIPGGLMIGQEYDAFYETGKNGFVKLVGIV